MIRILGLLLFLGLVGCNQSNSPTAEASQPAVAPNAPATDSAPPSDPVAASPLDAPLIGSIKEIPVAFHGRWASTPERCIQGGESVLSIHGDRIDFYESRASVLSVRIVKPLEIEVDLESTGEGSTWRSVRSFALSEDERTLTDPPRQDPIHKFVRVRCD